MWEMNGFEHRKLRSIKLPDAKNSDAIVMLKYENLGIPGDAREQKSSKD